MSTRGITVKKNKPRFFYGLNQYEFLTNQSARQVLSVL